MVKKKQYKYADQNDSKDETGEANSQNLKRKRTRSRSRSQDSEPRQWSPSNNRNSSKQKKSKLTPKRSRIASGEANVMAKNNNNAVPIISVDNVTGIHTFSRDSAIKAVIRDFKNSEEFEPAQEHHIDVEAIVGLNPDDSNKSGKISDSDPIDQDGIKVEVSASEDDFETDEEDNTETEMEQTQRTTGIQGRRHHFEDNEDENEVVLNKRKPIHQLSKEELMKNPAFLEVMEEMLEKKLKTGGRKSNTTPQGFPTTPQRISNLEHRQNVIKSPSDATLYTPALKKISIDSSFRQAGVSCIQQINDQISAIVGTPKGPAMNNKELEADQPPRPGTSVSGTGQ